MPRNPKSIEAIDKMLSELENQATGPGDIAALRTIMYAYLNMAEAGDGGAKLRLESYGIPVDVQQGNQESGPELGYRLIQKYFPQSEWGNAYAVMMAESGGQNIPSRYNAGGGEDSHGLFQINLRAHPQMRGLVNDPEANVAYAAKLWSEQGWNPWSAAKNLGLHNRGGGQLPQVGGAGFGFTPMSIAMSLPGTEGFAGGDNPLEAAARGAFAPFQWLWNNTFGRQEQQSTTELPPGARPDGFGGYFVFDEPTGRTIHWVPNKDMTAYEVDAAYSGASTPNPSALQEKQNMLKPYLDAGVITPQQYMEAVFGGAFSPNTATTGRTPQDFMAELQLKFQQDLAIVYLKRGWDVEDAVRQSEVDMQKFNAQFGLDQQKFGYQQTQDARQIEENRRAREAQLLSSPRDYLSLWNYTRGNAAPTGGVSRLPQEAQGLLPDWQRSFLGGGQPNVPANSNNLLPNAIADYTANPIYDQWQRQYAQEHGGRQGTPQEFQTHLDTLAGGRSPIQYNLNAPANPVAEMPAPPLFNAIKSGTPMGAYRLPAEAGLVPSLQSLSRSTPSEIQGLAGYYSGKFGLDPNDIFARAKYLAPGSTLPQVPYRGMR